MNILFVHQNFPAQFVGIANYVTKLDGITIAAIGASEFKHPRIDYRRYVAPVEDNGSDIIRSEADARIRRAEAVAAQARLLRLDGFIPDIILAHIGWSETLFLRDLFPSSRIVCYCEYYYRRTGNDIDFDPEFPLQSLDILHRMRIRNAMELAAMDDADLCLSPTDFQRSTYPEAFRSRIELFHEGIDLARLTPTGIEGKDVRTSLSIPADSPIVTYCSRYLEPMRGFHIFMRSLPQLLETASDAHVVIIGAEEGGYGPTPQRGETWKSVMLAEAGDRIDLARVHFTGRIGYEDYVAFLKASATHVYLTYPFVLSWSALETMALGKAIVGSSTPPVAEFLQDGKSACLVDFFDAKTLAAEIAALLSAPDRRSDLGQAARQVITDRKLDRASASERLWAMLKTL